MKRTSFILLLFLVGTAQLVAQARLTVNKESYDLGQIEWNKPKTVEFNLRNTGDIPLVIANVTTSCACTLASWPKLPLQPDEAGVVRVEFDAKALGQFYKEVEVYSNSSPNIIYLSFTGEVVRKITDFSQSHPIELGGLRISEKSIDFGDVLYGSKTSLEFEVVNETGQPYTPILMHTPSYLNVRSSDMYLQQGEKGTLKLTLDTELLANYGQYTTDVYLSRFVGDKISKANKIPLSFTLLPDLREVEQNTSAPLPSLDLDKSELDLKYELLRKTTASDRGVLFNAGSGDLEILKIQTFSPAVGVKLSDTVLPAEASAKLKIKIDKKKVLSDQDNFDILLITNDPYHPKVMLKVLH